MAKMLLHLTGKRGSGGNENAQQGICYMPRVRFESTLVDSCLWDCTGRKQGLAFLQSLEQFITR